MKPHNSAVFLIAMFMMLGCGGESSRQLAAAAEQSGAHKVEQMRSKSQKPAQNREQIRFTRSQLRSLEVTASAYTSTVGETDKTPSLAAWGDTLKPGMKAIAVSRDLIKMGLTHRTKVLIDGFEGEYLVLDKMNKRWTRKIDIYMGLDRTKAKNWGKRKVNIHW